jgi:hypothetical protein
MEKKLWRIALTLVLIFASGCVTSAPSEEPSPTQTQASSILSKSSQPLQSEGLQTYIGQGISFQYPLNARVEPADPWPPATGEIHIVGPDISIKPGDADWVYSGPAYDLTISFYDNPDALNVETWARNYLISVWEEAQELGAPATMPVDDTGAIKEEYVGTAVIAGLPAYWIEWFGGDSAILTYYVVHGEQVVAMSFHDYPLPNQPLNEFQMDIYSLLMATFQFENE